MGTERWTGVLGLALAVSVIGGIVFETMGPNLSMTPDEMFKSFKSANTDVLIATALLVVQKVVLVAFAVGLSNLVARSGRDGLLANLILVAATLQVAITMVYVATYAAVASAIGQLTVPVVFGISTVGAAMDVAGDPFLGLMIAAAARGLARSGLSAQWTGRLGEIAGGLLLISTISLLAPQNFFLMLPLLLAVLLTIVWLAAASIALLRGRTPAIAT